MGGVLGKVLRTTGKAVFNRSGASFALLTLAAASAIVWARRMKQAGAHTGVSLQ